MCLAAVAVVTDMDAGVEPDHGVRQQDVFAMFAANIERLKERLTRVISDLPDPGGCSCNPWAEDIELSYEIP